MSEQFIKKLSGHSGCEISLFQNDGSFFVRKTAGHPEYNKRLRTQIAKQISFRPLHNHIYAPRVYKTGITNGIFWFDMQYLNCHTMAQHMESVPITEIAELIDTVVGEFHIADSCTMPETNDIFQKKIKSLYSNVPKKQIYMSALDKLSKFDFGDIPYSICHGDLTLENILIDVNGDIYLIDFLDSFFDSYMIDVAKLLQDLELHWSYRHTKMSPNLALRLLVAKEALLERIARLPNGNEQILEIYYILLMNIMRIVPYATDETTYNWLNNAINKVISIIDTKEQIK